MSVAVESIGRREPVAPIPRACGAIALVHVLRSHGVEASLQDVWPYVTMPDPFGTTCARSFLLAAYASRLGLQSAVLQCQALQAWDALHRCVNLGLSVIINHQGIVARQEGHFSVLASLSPDSSVMDDPISRTQQVIARDQFLERWKSNKEITGHVLIAIGGPLRHASSSRFPSCPRCTAKLIMAPSELYKLNDWKRGGLWERFFCQGCDAGFRAF